jgi:hypothetical protein
MPSTKVKTTRTTDIRTWTELEVQKRIDKSVGEYVDATGPKLWQMAADFNEIRIVHGYNTESIKSKFKDAFARKNNIAKGKGNKTGNPKWESYVSIVSQLALVANRSMEEFKVLRDSGKSFTKIWVELADRSYKKTKKASVSTEEALENANKFMEEKRRMVDEGELTDVKDHSKDDEIRKKLGLPANPDAKTPSTNKSEGGWTAPAKDLDKEWVKQSRKILHDDPKLFLKMIRACVDSPNQLLNEDAYNVIEEYLKERLETEYKY